MDRDSKWNEDLKIRRKLSNTAKKIKRNRENIKKLLKETSEFQEIKQLLNTTDNEDVCAEDNAVASDIPVPDSLALCTIPVHVPGIDIYQEKKLFQLFDEKRLTLKSFLGDTKTCNAFGKDEKVPNEDLFRNLIAHRLAENILPDEERCHTISLYVLYLLSVHPEKRFVSACVDFLKHRRFKISSFEVLPIFVNYGADVETLTGSNLELKLPFKVKSPAENNATCFPHYNVDMVGNLLLHYAYLDLIKIEPELRILVTSLTRLTLDLKIRTSSNLSVYSNLVSVLSEKLAELIDEEDVSTCLHLNQEHVLNQVEIATVVLTPISVRVHESLINKTINSILMIRNRKLKGSLKIKDVQFVLKSLIRKKLSSLEIYSVLRLIYSSLPTVTATEKDVGDINNLLACLEANLFAVKDSLDLVRLKLEIAKLKNHFTHNSHKSYISNF